MNVTAFFPRSEEYHSRKKEKEKERGCGCGPLIQSLDVVFLMTDPGSQYSVQAKVWTCYSGLAQQQFYYTGEFPDEPSGIGRDSFAHASKNGDGAGFRRPSHRCHKL